MHFSPNNPHTAVCLMCHDKNSSSELDALHRIEQICRRHPMDGSMMNIHRSFNWGIHHHCRYGLPCSNLDRMNLECRTLAFQLEPVMIDIAKHDETGYHEILMHCQGNFPAVYRQMERIHAQAAHDTEK